MADELLKTLILQLPNFVGLVVAVYILAKQNARLMDTLIEVCRKNECEEKEAGAG